MVFFFVFFFPFFSLLFWWFSGCVDVPGMKESSRSILVFEYFGWVFLCRYSGWLAFFLVWEVVLVVCIEIKLSFFCVCVYRDVCVRVKLTHGLQNTNSL